MKIAITRPRDKSKDTIEIAKKKGLDVVIVPAVEIVPRPKQEVLDKIDLKAYDWLVITSSTGAEIMHRYFGKLLRSLKIATIGPKTKETLEKKGIKVSLVPDEYKAENLAECLINQGIEGKKVLLVRASTGREVLPKKLKKHCIVKDVILYDVIAPRHVHMKEVMKADAVIFTSSRSVKNLYAAIGKELKQGLKNVKVCAIGPITARTLEDFGIKVDVVPSEYTVEACLEALR